MPPNATVAGVNFTGKILKWSISVGPYQNKVLTPKKIISTNGECTRANDWPTVKDKAYLDASIIPGYLSRSEHRSVLLEYLPGTGTYTSEVQPVITIRILIL